MELDLCKQAHFGLASTKTSRQSINAAHGNLSLTSTPIISSKRAGESMCSKGWGYCHEQSSDLLEYNM